MSDFAIQLVAGSKLETAIAEHWLKKPFVVEFAGVKVRVTQASYHTSGAIKYATIHGREVEE